MTPNDLTWHFQKIDNVKHFNASKLKEFHRVCVNGFGIAMDWDSDNKLKLSKSNLLGELLDREGELCGIAYYCLPEKRLENTYLLWENGICLVKKAQKLGLSKAALEKIKLTFSEYLFGWFGGKTQNPKMFLRYKKFGKTFPFDELYLTTKGTNVMNFLINNIEEVKNLYESKQLNLDSGICFNAYSHGYLGDYNVGLKGTELFESQLKKMGFNRSRGDAIIVIAHNDEYQDNKIKEAKHNDFVDRYSNRQGD